MVITHYLKVITRVATRVVACLACGVSATLFLVGGNLTAFPCLANQAAADDKPVAKPQDKSKSTPDSSADSKDKPQPQPRVSKSKTADVKEIKEKEEEEAIPLDLTPHVAIKAANFEKITRYAWKAVPHGTQTYANIPVQIDGAIFLWGGRNTENGQKYPEKVSGIAVKQKFETLYLYHGAFFEGDRGTPVYEVVFHYADGTTASDKVLNGEDIRDWYANRSEKELGPSGKRSALAWDGDFVTGDKIQPIRFCLTAMENPHPKLEVTALDLVSSKTKTAGCILSITPGKSGLLRQPKDAKPKTE